MKAAKRRQDADYRAVSRVLTGIPASDGAGVELTRVIGTPELSMLDPFLLLDVMHSDRPSDYIAGFPPHPHRGFETVTYLLAGRFRHRDSTGNEGVLESGGVQWMSAGSGILHSEMPEQADGLLHGFQLWINLPRAHKMDPPAYQEFGPDAVPEERRTDGVRVRVVAGCTNQGTRGPVEQPLTEPLYLDVGLPGGAVFEQSLPADHNAFIYLLDGGLSLPGLDGADTRAEPGQIAVLARGDRVAPKAGDDGARFLLLAGRPIGEPVARGGPFVMNTRQEILRAYEDYQAGRFGDVPRTLAP